MNTGQILLHITVMNPNRHFGPTAGLENYDTFIVYQGHSRHVMNAAFEFSLDEGKVATTYERP